MPAVRCLILLVESPSYEVKGMGQVPYLDVAGTTDPETERFPSSFSIVTCQRLTLLRSTGRTRRRHEVLSSVLLTGDDLKASNTFDAPQRVVPRTLDKPSITGDRAKFEVPARSYSVIQWGA